jgi:hypothetical protein
LVEQQKLLDGGSWTVSALYLQGISLVRRNNEWHHFDPLGTAQVIANSSAQVVSNNLYQLFGVLRYQQGSAQTPWRGRTTIHSSEDFVISGGLAGSTAIGEAL